MRTPFLGRYRGVTELLFEERQEWVFSGQRRLYIDHHGDDGLPPLFIRALHLADHVWILRGNVVLLAVILAKVKKHPGGCVAFFPGGNKVVIRRAHAAIRILASLGRGVFFQRPT